LNKELIVQLKALEDNYLKRFLAYSIKRTSSIQDAEDLAQEIAYQCLVALYNKDIKNHDKYFWGIAHNTYKRWLNNKTNHLSLDLYRESYGDIVDLDSLVTTSVDNERAEKIKKELSILSGFYREALVYFYYDQLSIQDISVKLHVSTEMVKYYLTKGKEKLKEAYKLSKEFGEKRYNPSQFSVYYSGIDFSRVNVWEVFKRKIPCQIALICYDKPCTVSEISLETGIPSVYIEDEIKVLEDTGLIISPVKNKFQINLFILKRNGLEQLKIQFTELYRIYVPYVIKIFEKYLVEIKRSEIFKHEVNNNRYAWYYMMKVTDFDYSNSLLSNTDFPNILSCGARAFIFADESSGSKWAGGHTPTHLDECVVWPCDIAVLGEGHFQKELRDPKKAQALYDVYKGRYKEEDKELYSTLIKEGYILKEGSSLVCNVAVTTKETKTLFDMINKDLTNYIKPQCIEIKENVRRIVKSSIPNNLKEYIHGYVETLISFYATTFFYEALYNKGFITVPERNEQIPIACNIIENI